LTWREADHSPPRNAEVKKVWLCTSTPPYAFMAQSLISSARDNVTFTLNMSTLRHRFKAFENRVLRIIFGPKRDEVTGGWRKLHSEELHNFYSSPSIITIIKSRRMKWQSM
jgi:hypothetical protein